MFVLEKETMVFCLLTRFPLRDFSLCAIIKDRNPLKKIQRSSAPLLQLFRVLHATSVSLGSNAVKLQVWKDENALKFKYVINFFWAS